MRFLSMWWVPFWCLGIFMVATDYKHWHHATFQTWGTIAGVWLLLNCFVTVVYGVSRLIGRATADSRPRR